MKKLEMKDLTDAEKAEITLLLQKAQANADHQLSNAERNRIRELAQWFDDLAPALESILPRIVDLFQFARGHYYHPVMAGSWSFRAMARAVAAIVCSFW